MLSFDWSSLILFSAIVNALITISILIFRSGKYTLDTIIWIIAILLSVVFMLTERIFRFSGLIDAFPNILFTTSPLFFFILPLMFVLQQKIAKDSKRWWIHFVIPIIFLIILLPTILLPGVKKLEMFQTEGLNDPIWLIAFYLLYALFYSIGIYQANKKHKAYLYNQFADPSLEFQLFTNRVILIVSLLTLTIPLALIVPYFPLASQQLAFFEKLLFIIFSIAPHLMLLSLLKSKDWVFAVKSLSPTSEKSTFSTIKNLPALKLELEEYINQHKPFFNQELQLPLLANQLGWTRSQLSAVINKGLGKTFYALINEYRLEAVTRRLEAGDHLKFSLDHITSECGFKSYVSFYRVFKKYHKQSPKSYLKTLNIKP